MGLKINLFTYVRFVALNVVSVVLNKSPTTYN